MRLPRPIRRLYRAHETLAKLSGFLIFLIVVALLYAAVLRSAPVTSVAGSFTPTPSPQAIGTPTATAPAAASPLPTPATPGAAPTPAPPIPLGQYGVKFQSNLSYGTPGNLAERLDLCTPVGATDLRPGVILIHSGGYVQGNKESYDPLCDAFASYGFVVASVNYRLAPQNKWPAPLVDVQLAVRWLRANAGQYNLDPARLCAMGDSVGAHLAIFLGVLTTIHPGDKASLLSDQSPQVSCVVDEFGPTDMGKLTNVVAWKQTFPVLFGETNKNNPAFLHDASPIYQVSSASAPMLIIQGTVDTIVPPSQSKTLQSKLQAANVPVSYISYPGGHSFEGLTGKQIQALILQARDYLIAQEQP